MNEINAQSTVPRGRALLALRGAALIGLGIAGYLLYLAMTGQTAPGCGEGVGGCSEVLSSRWSKVLGLPVSAFAVVTYVALLAVSLHARAASPQHHRDGAWRMMALLGVAAGASALWFIALQLFVLQHVCYWCMTAHGCSLVIAGVAFLKARNKLAWLGATPVLVLAALQLIVPPPAPTIDGQSIIFDNLDPHASPTLGDPDAPHVMALLFDYNCAFCRQTHQQVADAVEHYEGKLVVVMLPTALDPACNKGAQAPGPHSATSCELARLALAVWIAQPTKFAAFDKQLISHCESFGDPDATPTRYLNRARLIAQQFVSSAQLDAALADPRIKTMLDSNGQVYGLAQYQGRRGVPRLIITGRAIPGLADADQLFELLERAYPDLADDQ